MGSAKVSSLQRTLEEIKRKVADAAKDYEKLGFQGMETGMKKRETGWFSGCVFFASWESAKDARSCCGILGDRGARGVSDHSVFGAQMVRNRVISG